MTTNATQSADRLESLERRSLIGGVSRFSIPPHAQHPAIAPSGLGTLVYPEIRRACAPLPSRRPNGRRIRPHRYPLLTEILIGPLRISNRKKTRVLRAPWRIAILDSATRSSSRHRTQWHRHSCLCAVAKPRAQRLAKAAASLSAEIRSVNRDAISNRDTAIRISSNPYHYSEFEISNRDKMRVLRRALFSLAKSRLSQATPYSEFRAQIDPAAPRAYTCIPPKEKPSWKIPSY